MKKRIVAFTTIGVLVSIIILKNLLFVEYKVEGVSMRPTYEEGSLLSINKYSHYFLPVKRFDVVVFRGPGKKEDYVKRVIGLPGDKIEYKDDQLLVNEEPVPEPYLSTNKLGTQTGDFTLKEKTGKRKIPEGYLFVIGDNRIQSYDSRHFGFVKADQVVGRVSE
ncbi:signal peptidase I [Metabacillus herbersteinensis]|uniref:Signal peptidase I n=1 Tax=Metabacillus herbersteinensis TaxID=283816 RepID=A0ABV6GLJ7_9BACI